MGKTSIKSSTPIYQPLIDEIRQSITSGELKPGNRIDSEHELVRKTGLSRVSIRRAVGKLVNEGLVERRPGKGVYVRDRRTTTREIQVLVPNLAISRCVQIVRGAKAFGMECGVRLHVCDAHGSVEEDIEQLRALAESGTDGAMILSLHRHGLAEVLYELQSNKFPFVLVDESLAGIEAVSIFSDNYQGGYAVGRELVSLGHRRIGFIGPLSAHTTKERLEGMRDAVNDAGIAFDRSLARDVDATLVAQEELHQAVDAPTRELTERPNPATAIFYAFDSMAAEGYKVLKTMGLRIPEDINVVGFDDDPVCRVLEPPLSTVRQQAFEIGRVAMEVLLQLMIDGKSERSSRVMATEWVPRRSTGRCSGFGSTTKRDSLALETVRSLSVS